MEKRNNILDLKNTLGNTALINAVQGGHEEIVKSILEKGANDKIRNSFSKNAHDYVSDNDT